MLGITRKNSSHHLAEVSLLSFITMRAAWAHEIDRLCAQHRLGVVELMATGFCQGYDGTPLWLSFDADEDNRPEGVQASTYDPKSQKLFQSDLRMAILFRRKQLNGKWGDPEIRFCELPCTLKLADFSTGETTHAQLQDDLAMLNFDQAQELCKHNFAIGNCDEGGNNMR